MVGICYKYNDGDYNNECHSIEVTQTLCTLKLCRSKGHRTVTNKTFAYHVSLLSNDLLAEIYIATAKMCWIEMRM